MQEARLPVHTRHVLALGLVLLMLLAACGTNGAGTTTTGSGSAGSPSATKAPTKAQNCGAVHSMRLLIVPADTSKAPGIEDCFWQAYQQQCQPATLNYVQSGVDTSTIHTFTLKSQNNQCVITDALQSQVLPRPAQTIGAYTCSGLTRKIDGLHFNSCGTEGDIVVPSGGVQ